ncbi:hypothetical protein OsJ_26396 [Oryza sativa Japonica Group]|uniref:Uncharacterized protein n=1 Tax=Oryza sativa subsp. japonica TaxID=39947 RepID=B9FZK7_ORYSJ|nr:hypothetical protein OsJ_26396 [Oryza sativa Japonica Group]
MAEMGASAAAAVPVIPEDVVIEILARVPDPTPKFAARWPPGNPGALPPRVLRAAPPDPGQREAEAHQGFSEPGGRRLSQRRAGAQVTHPLAPGGGGGLFLTDFVRNAAGAGLFDQAKPLAARGGLLLVRVLPSPSPAPQNALHLCVCNLLTGSHDVLPPLPMDCFEKDGARGYAILTAADHRVSRNPSGGYNTFFQVLLLSIHHGNHQVYLHRFSSAAASAAAAAVIFEISWSTPRNCSEQIRAILGFPSGTRFQVFSNGGENGLSSWEKESLYTLDVSIDTDNIGATNIPIDPPPTVFHQSWLYVYLHRFSSAAASAAAAAVIFEISWSTPRNCSEQIRGYVWGPSGNRVAAVSHGGAHWALQLGKRKPLHPLMLSIDTDNIGAPISN